MFLICSQFHYYFSWQADADKSVFPCKLWVNVAIHYHKRKHQLTNSTWEVTANRTPRLHYIAMVSAVQN